MANQETSEKQEKKNRKLGLKTKIMLLELLVIIVMAFLGWYFWGRIQTANRYLDEHETLLGEKNRCQELISQQSGNFEDYEYCKTLLQKFK